MIVRVMTLMMAIEMVKMLRMIKITDDDGREDGKEEDDDAAADYSSVPGRLLYFGDRKVLHGPEQWEALQPGVKRGPRS